MSNNGRLKSRQQTHEVPLRGLGKSFPNLRRQVLCLCCRDFNRPWIIWAHCFGLWLLATLGAAAQPGVTTYPQMTAQLEADAKLSPLIHIASLGQSARGHRELWLARLSDPQDDPRHTVRLLILCRQHGDEPASTEAILGLIHRVASGGDPALRAALSHVTLYFVPMVNPDGAGANTRVNGAGADLNRDWGVFHQPETQAVASAARLIEPSLVVDAHNWDGNDEYDADCVEVPRAMDSRHGSAAQAMQQQLVTDLAVSGYAVHPTAWGADANPHLAHRWFTRQQMPSLLVETHYGPVSDRADFERRQGMYTALIHSLAKHFAAPWLLKPSAETHEASLFPLMLPAAAHTGHLGTLSYAPKIAPAWLWAFGLSLLALWGMGLRKTDTPAFVAVRPPARYSYARDSRKRLGTETISHSGQRKAVSSPPR